MRMPVLIIVRIRIVTFPSRRLQRGKQSRHFPKQCRGRFRPTQNTPSLGDPQCVRDTVGYFAVRGGCGRVTARTRARRSRTTTLRMMIGMILLLRQRRCNVHAQCRIQIARVFGAQDRTSKGVRFGGETRHGGGWWWWWKWKRRTTAGLRRIVVMMRMLRMKSVRHRRFAGASSSSSSTRSVQATNGICVHVVAHPTAYL